MGHSRYPIVWADLFANELRRKLCKEEGAVENSHPTVIVIGVELEVI